MNQSDFPQPPIAEIISDTLINFGLTRIDNYFWLKDKNNPKVIEYINAENNYTDSVMASTVELQNTIYNEILGRIKDNNELENLYDNIHIGDTIILANKKLSLTSIKDNTLYLNEIGNFSTKKDDIYVNSLADGKKVVLQDLIKDKYVFIDFWGSWCGWCIKSMPTIKELYEKVKDRKDVLILGIAYENKKNNEDLKKIIKEKEIKFPNYYVYKENINSIKYPQMVYNISRYPTYLILDKEGNVVEKMTGSQSTEKIVASFLQLIGSTEQVTL